MSAYTLTREQEALAFDLIRKGGKEGEIAREQFIKLNQGLVGHIAKRYRNRGRNGGLSWADLVSAGNMGLIQAVNRFDPSLGKFSDYAGQWIEGEIKQLFKSSKRQKDAERLIVQTEFGVPLAFDSVRDYEGDGQFEDNEKEPSRLKEHIDLQEYAKYGASDSREKLIASKARAEGLGSSAGCAEWDSLRGEDPSDDPRPAGGVAINFAGDQSTGVMGIDAELLPALEQAIQQLEDPRQLMVIAMHLGLLGHKKHTFAEIGQAFGFSSQRAEAIQRAAFTELREDPTLQMIFEQTL
jgi:RNA polymerase sigma factor (sigma-70 family)